MKTKIKAKFVRLLALAVSSLLLAVTFTACGSGKISNSENFLEVYMWEAGYGREWLDKELEAFKNEDWVKEKYPSFDYKSIVLLGPIPILPPAKPCWSLVVSL